MKKKFKSKYEHRKTTYDIDYKDIDHLCDIIDSLPGLKVISNDISDIWFRVDEKNNQGLFFLTRCVDSRYFKHDWNISLTVGDQYREKRRPIYYHLHSKQTELKHHLVELKLQINDLIKNMEHHLNHESFMEGYDLEIPFIYERELKLNTILK